MFSILLLFAYHNNNLANNLCNVLLEEFMIIRNVLSKLLAKFTYYRHVVVGVKYCTPVSHNLYITIFSKSKFKSH